MKRLLVVGAGRGIGLTVHQLLDQRVAVRAFARSAAGILSPAFPSYTGNMMDADDVAAAAPGIAAVILTGGATWKPEMPLELDPLFPSQICLGTRT